MIFNADLYVINAIKGGDYIKCTLLELKYTK